MGAASRNRASGLVNRGLRRLSALRSHPPAFDIHRLLLEARRQARLDDFGEPSFREGLDRLVASLDDEAQLAPLGRRAWRRALVGLLARRLAVRDQAKKTAGGPRRGAVSPIVVVGADARGVGARLARDGSAEVVGCPVNGDAELLSVSFASLAFGRSASVSGYDDWLLAADLGAAYDVHHHQLEEWAASRPPAVRPVLTADDHLWNLDHMYRSYPTSTLVVVGGGALETSPAVIAEIVERRARTSDRVDQGRVGDWWAERVRIGLARVERHRELWPPARVHDVPSPATPPCTSYRLGRASAP